MHIPANSIRRWRKLCDRVVQVGYQPPNNVDDLHRLVWKEGKTLRKYIQRFIQMHHNIPDILEEAVVATFQANVCTKKMLKNLNTHNVHIITELVRLADKCARAGKQHECRSKVSGMLGSSLRTGNRGNRKRKPRVVSVVEPAKKNHKPEADREAAAAAPKTEPYCKIHCMLDMTSVIAQS